MNNLDGTRRKKGLVIAVLAAAYLMGAVYILLASVESIRARTGVAYDTLIVPDLCAWLLCTTCICALLVGGARCSHRFAGPAGAVIVVAGVGIMLWQACGASAYVDAVAFMIDDVSPWMMVWSAALGAAVGYYVTRGPQVVTDWLRLTALLVVFLVTLWLAYLPIARLFMRAYG